MKKKNIRLTTIAISLLLLGLGIIIGIVFHHFKGLPLAETINIIDLATLVTTIFLAVYVPAVLDRKLEINKAKKDLIERRIEELQSFYRKINLLVQQESKSQKDNLIIKNTLDICYNRLLTIFTLIEYSKLKTSFKDEINTLKGLCLEHKRLLWSDRLEEKDFTYSEEIQEKEEQLYNLIDKESCLLIFKVNEA